MSDNSRSALSHAPAITSMPIASIGFALAVFISESRRMSSHTNVTSSGIESIVAGVAVLIGLAVLAALYNSKPSMRLHRHTIASFVVCGVLSLVVLDVINASVLPDIAVLRLVERIILQLGEAFLLACWCEVFLLLTARQSALTIATGFIALGFVNAFTSLLWARDAVVVVAMFPLLSLVCLYWFKDRAAVVSDEFGEALSDVPAAFYFDRSLIPDPQSRDRITSFLNFLLPVLFCPVVFGFLHYSWVPAQDGGRVSILIQLFAALGTSLGGVLLYLLIQHFWGRRKLAMYNMFTLLVLTMAFALVGFLPSSMAYAYVLPLNVAQKIVLFQLWMMPFLIPSRKSPLRIWCLSFGLYQLGKIMSNVLYSMLSPEGYTVAAAALVLLLIVGILLGIVLDQGKRDYSYHSVPDRMHQAAATASVDKSATQNSVSDSTAQEHDADDVSGASVSYPSKEGRPSAPEGIDPACERLAAQYRLSRREEDVLALIARGMVAHEVAEALVISDSTAKTHMRNLYAKLGVHSQSEVILMVTQA